MKIGVNELKKFLRKNEDSNIQTPASSITFSIMKLDDVDIYDVGILEYKEKISKSFFTFSFIKVDRKNALSVRYVKGDQYTGISEIRELDTSKIYKDNPLCKEFTDLIDLFILAIEFNQLDYAEIHYQWDSSNEGGDEKDEECDYVYTSTLIENKDGSKHVETKMEKVDME